MPLTTSYGQFFEGLLRLIASVSKRHRQVIEDLLAHAFRRRIAAQDAHADQVEQFDRAAEFIGGEALVEAARRPDRGNRS